MQEERSCAGRPPVQGNKMELAGRGPEDRESPLSAPRGGDGAFGLASYKIVLVGDSGVGKTNLLAAFVAANEARLAGARGENGADRGGPRGGYSEQRQPTIGCEFYSSSLVHPVDKTKINVQIWDTAGQERYRSISAGQYRRASGALLVYDVTSRASLESALTYWHSELGEWPLAECLCLVGNKGTCPALVVERCACPRSCSLSLALTTVTARSSMTRPSLPTDSGHLGAGGSAARRQRGPRRKPTFIVRDA